MADSKVTALTENTTPAGTDLLYIIDDPGGSAASQKITITNLLSLVDASGVTYTPTTATDWDSDTDPGDVDGALDQLAERVDDLEGAGTGGGICSVVFHPYNNEPPASAYATLDLRNYHPVLDFDADTDESAVFSGILPANYASGGLTVYIHWMATSDTNAAHMCRWDAAIERCNTDLDSDSFPAVQSATGNPNGTSGIITVTSIAFTDGAQMDSLAAGEMFRLKITRDANHGTDDDMTGDAEVAMVEVRETAA